MADPAKALDQALEVLRERDIDPQTAGGAVALEFLLRDNASQPVPPDSRPSQATTESVSLPGSSEESDPVGRLAEWSRVEPARLGDFFEFSDQIRLTIPSGRLPKSKANKQRILTLLTLTADRIGNGVSQTDWNQVNAVIDDYAAFDQNLGKNVAKNSNLIIRSGKPKAYVYRVTQPGLDRARDLIEDLASSEGTLEP